MSRDDIDRVLERIHQGTAARMRTIAAARGTSGASAPGVRRGHAIGARVFDPITGHTGEVLSAASENIVVPTTDR